MTDAYKRVVPLCLLHAVSWKGRCLGNVIAGIAIRNLKFLPRLNREFPKDLDLCLILDNYGTHKYPEVKKWLKNNSRLKLHFTPTGPSRLNLVERWFGELTEKRIRVVGYSTVCLNLLIPSISTLMATTRIQDPLSGQPRPMTF